MKEYSYYDVSGDKIRHLENRNLQLIKPGTLTKNVSYNTKQKAYSSQNSMFSNCALMDTTIYQHYGFTSVPLTGSKNITLGVAGSNTNNVIIATHDTRYQPNDLIAGEVSIHDYQGQCLELRQNQQINMIGQKQINIQIGENQQITITDGNIEITGDVTIDKDVTINGSLHVKGKITSDDDVVAGSISLKSHIHSVTSAPGNTSAPS